MYPKMNISNWICYAVGYVFIISGSIKLINPEFSISFANLGLPFPSATLFLVAIVEIGCGALIVARMYVKQATIPLVIIMAGAIYLTKVPVIFKQGFLSFAFDARLDIVMIVLLLLIGQHVMGKKTDN